MVRYLEIRYHRLTETLNLHILRIILTDGHRRINDIGDHHHYLSDLLLHLGLLCIKLCKLLCICSHLLLDFLSLFLLAFLHQCAYLL